MMAGSTDRTHRLLRFTTIVSGSEEVFNRWKYWITGITALAIMTAVVTVKITSKIREEDAACGTNYSTSRSESLSERAKYVLNEIASNINASVDPCEDFYEYACGSFQKRYPRGEDKAEVNYQTLHAEQVYKRIVEQLQGAKLLSNDTPYPLKYIKRFWNACLNDVSKDLAHRKEMTWYLQELAELGSLQSLFEKVTKDGYNVLFTVKINREYDFPTHVIIGPPKFELGTKQSVRENHPRMEYYNFMFGTLSEVLEDISDPDEILNLDRLLSSSVTEDTTRVTSIMSVDELSNKTKIHWEKVLSSLVRGGSFVTHVEVEDVGYINQFQRVLNETNPGDERLARYLKLYVVHQICFFLNIHCRQLQFDFLQDLTELNSPKYKNFREYEERTCFKFLAEKFEDLIFKIYETEDADAENYCLDLVVLLESEVRSTVNEITWMDDETKARAGKFIDSISINFDVKEPYVDGDFVLNGKYEPTFFKDQDEIELFSHFRGISAYVRNEEWMLDEFDRQSTWPISLFSALPHVSQRRQKLFVPDFFIRGPFAAVDLPAQIKFGFLASMLAHEMMHTFDEVADYHSKMRGSKFWSKWTRSTFHDWTKCLVEAHNGPAVKMDVEEGGIKSTELNETFRLNGILADVIGVNVAYKAYKHINSSNLIDTDDFPEPLKNLTADQLFFLSFANVHCSNQLDQVSSDVITEATNRFMVNLPLAHNMEFAHAFRCKAGSSMNPPKKCPFT